MKANYWGGLPHHVTMLNTGITSSVETACILVRAWSAINEDTTHHFG